MADTLSAYVRGSAFFPIFFRPRCHRRSVHAHDSSGEGTFAFSFRDDVHCAYIQLLLQGSMPCNSRSSLTALLTVKVLGTRSPIHQGFQRCRDAETCFPQYKNAELTSDDLKGDERAQRVRLCRLAGYTTGVVWNNETKDASLSLLPFLNSSICYPTFNFLVFLLTAPHNNRRPVLFPPR